jgi:hypothetical protein
MSASLEDVRRQYEAVEYFLDLIRDAAKTPQELRTCTRPQGFVLDAEDLLDMLVDDWERYRRTDEPLPLSSTEHSDIDLVVASIREAYPNERCANAWRQVRELAQAVLIRNGWLDPLDPEEFELVHYWSKR